jgi:phosphate:Na+ symporter
MLRVVTELENITDSCLNLAIILDKSVAKRIKFGSAESEALAPYTKLVRDFLDFVRDNAASGINDEGLRRAEQFENAINDSRVELRKLSRRHLKAGADVKAELMFIDVVRHVEKIGDFAFAVSEALREMR